MSMNYRMLFPACASFGPMFMVTGLQGRTSTWSFVFAAAGALMTSAALFMLFPRPVEGTSSTTPRERRDQVLFWCAVMVVGVLMWLVTDWLMPLR